MFFKMKNLKKAALAACLLLFAKIAFSQVAATAAPQKAADPTLNNWLFIALAVAAFVVFAGAMWAMIRANQIMYRQVMRLTAEKNGLPDPFAAGGSLASMIQEPEPTGVTRFFKRFWSDAAPIAEEAKIMGEHEFDGIRELDNNLPPWWVAMFWATIFWAFAYMIYYHWGGNGPTQKQEYDQAIAQAKIEKAQALSSAAESVNEENVTLLTDKTALADGQFIFKSVCAACHGQLGEGTVGPNFTDENWIHGGGIKNVFKTIKYGVPEKGMISWQSQIKPSDMQKVASYIVSLKGTNPPNPKAPQGEIWKEEAAAAAPADSTKTK